jgi:hypothetical protein
VSVFSSEQDVYEHIGRLLEEICYDDALANQLQRADTIVQYRYHDPVATITVDLRRAVEPCVLLGACDLEPEIVLSMAADTAHRLFLGQVNVTVALARRDILTLGPVAKILKLVPLVKPFFPRYPAQLEGAGRPDLVGA